MPCGKAVGRIAVAVVFPQGGCGKLVHDAGQLFQPGVGIDA
jgi:hypothetical protein